MNYRDIQVVILAGGNGKRMKTALPKVFLKINGIPMLKRIVNEVSKIVDKKQIIVVGNPLYQIYYKEYIDCKVMYQYEKKGTGAAVKTALPGIFLNNVLIIPADLPLITSNELKQIIDDSIKQKKGLTVIGMNVSNPYGYGRIIINNNDVRIVEENDLKKEEGNNCLINTGIYYIKTRILQEYINYIMPNEISNEYYFTDLIKIINDKIHNVKVISYNYKKELEAPNDLDNLQKLLLSDQLF